MSLNPLPGVADFLMRAFGINQAPRREGDQIRGYYLDMRATGCPAVDGLLESIVRGAQNEQDEWSEDTISAIQGLADLAALAIVTGVPEVTAAIRVDKTSTLPYFWEAQGTQSEQWFYTQQECAQDLAEWLGGQS